MTHYYINHPRKQAVSFCHVCKQYFCSECLVMGSDYYYCKSSECQTRYRNDEDNHVPEKEAISSWKDNPLKRFLSHWKIMDNFQGITTVLIINAVVLLLLGILAVKYYLVHSMRNSSVFATNGAGNETWQIIWGIGLIGAALLFTFGARVMHRKKTAPGTETAQNISYGIGWLCIVSPLGLIAMIIYSVCRKKTPAMQALILTVIFFLLRFFIYNPLNTVKSVMSLHPLLVSTSPFECNQGNFVRMVADIETRFFLVPLIIVGIVRLVSIWRDMKQNSQGG